MSDLNEEEKKAIENLKTDIRYSDLLASYNDDIDTILNLIEKQEKTIKDLIKWRNYYKSLCNDIRKYKNKVIDEMAKDLNAQTLKKEMWCPLENKNLELYGKLACSADMTCLKCLKQYFYRKVEKNDKS